MPAYFHFPYRVQAHQIPREGGLPVEVRDWLISQLGDGSFYFVSESGAVNLTQKGEVKEIAHPGDWLVSTISGNGETVVTTYPADVFLTLFGTAEAYEPTYKRTALPPSFPAPPIFFSALDALAEVEAWSTSDQHMLGMMIMHLVNSQIPAGYAALKMEDLMKVPLEDYNRLREIFPALPERQ